MDEEKMGGASGTGTKSGTGEPVEHRLKPVLLRAA